MTVYSSLGSLIGKTAGTGLQCENQDKVVTIRSCGRDRDDKIAWR